MIEKKDSNLAIYLDAIRLGVRSRHFWHLFILGILLIYCILFYYFGELVNLFKWETLKIDFFYGAHDVQRIFFLAPIIYAGYIFGVKAVIIVTLVSAFAILPRFIVALYGYDPLWRIIMFIVIAGAVGYITARLRRSHFQRKI